METSEAERDVLAAASGRGCDSAAAAGGREALELLSDGCKRAELVLRRLRHRRELRRQQAVEDEADEAVGGLARAFVMFCMLRVVIANYHARQHRARVLAAAERPLLPL